MKRLFLLGALLVSTLVSAQYVKSNGKAIVDGSGDTLLIRAMGIGGWMVQEGYMLQTASFANPQHKIKDTIEDLIGATATEAFYDAWLENHFNKSDVDSMAAWGFNTIRVPMHYNLFTLPIEEEPVLGQNTWLNKGFNLLDSVVTWAEDAGLYVILDLHAAPGGQGYDQGISDYDPTKPSLWESVHNRTKTVALWKKLAEKFATDTTIAGYDLINEPNWNLPGGTLLRNLYEDITDSIRTVDTNHIIFIEGNWFANTFTGLTPPWDNNMAYSPHKYWSPVNSVADIQYGLDLRDTYNVPIWFGETGKTPMLGIQV
jgi:aryl-phospho-beta-D-glucosidase BglC (GH1 family)